ncbi:MAG: T9SS type A sorting domain-containing protein, partial [Bacteroidales bacterium]|nr:T9SS type A sorting domain-containing protein [Bacteroidales bacterium]
GDSIFSHVDSINVVVESTYYPNDTILLPCPLPDDSIWVSVNPYLFLHNSQLMLLPGDEIRMPCDSVFVPETNWQWIWSTKGVKLDTNFYDSAYVISYFKQILIPITDTARFFKKNFQFRFRNYVSLANNILPSWQSNMDQWHIDYIYLNINRTHKDTTYKDLTFVEPAPTMLKRYEAMPYNQFVSDPIQEMIDSVNILISNLDTLSHNSIYKYLLLNQSGVPIDSCLRGNWDIPPVYDFGFLDYVYFSRPPVCFGFYPIDFNVDSAVFIVKHILSSAPGSFENLGDTMYFKQKFYNYYAYDDGVPEAGYGLKGYEPKLAYRFSLNKPDTLRAIQMYFNETLSGANQQYFYVSVWNDNNGTPGDVIYSQGGEKPQFTNSLDQLYTYYLDSAVVVTGTFYIGWIQTTDDNLNIGFDRNNNAQGNIFYNTSGTWIQSMYEGALIMRPLLGKAIHDYPSNPNLPATVNLKLSPNPVKSSKLFIDLPLTLNNPMDNNDLSMEIYNIMGQVVYNGIYQQELNVSFFDNGLYIVVVKRKDASEYFSGKLIILH